MDYADVFKRFSSLNILIVGDVMVDSYWWGKVERISPEAPVPVCTVRKKENRLGGAANVALNVAAMGAKPIICSVVGDDMEGRILKGLFQEQNIETDGLLFSTERCTTVKTRILGNKSQMLRIDEETELPLSNKEQAAFLQRIEKIIESNKPNAIIFQDYDKGVITKELIERLVAVAKAKAIPTCVDPKKRNFLFYKNVSLFKPNLKELKEGLKADIETPKEEALYQAALTLHQKQGIEKVFITLSEYGVFIADFTSQEPKVEMQPAYLRKIADVSGAGDTVISVASLCMALGLGASETAKISNMSGGLVCESVGVVPIDKEKLLSELLKNK